MIFWLGLDIGASDLPHRNATERPEGVDVAFHEGLLAR